MFVSIFGAPLGGVLSDRLGNRWLVTTITTLLGMVGFLLIAGKNPVVLLLGVLVGAGASGSLQTLTTALAGDTVSHEQRGRSMGILQTSGDLGSALGPLVAYALIPWSGLAGAYLLCAGLFLLGVIILLLAKPIFTGQ
jgi:MFS family permease